MIERAASAAPAPAAIAASSAFSSVADKAAKRNLIHPNKAANLKSKTAKAIAGIGATA